MKMLVLSLLLFNSLVYAANETAFERLQSLFQRGNTELGSVSFKKATEWMTPKFEEGDWAGKCLWFKQPNTPYAAMMHVYVDKTEVDPIIGGDGFFRIGVIGHPSTDVSQNYYLEMSSEEAALLHEEHKPQIEAIFGERPTSKLVRPYGWELSWRTRVTPSAECRDGKCMCAHEGSIRSAQQRVSPYEFHYYLVELRCPWTHCSTEPCDLDGTCEKTAQSVPYGTPVAYCYLSEKK